MRDPDLFVRDAIRSLKPYSSARDEFYGSEGVFLDANENPFGTLNRYPDPYQRLLKSRLSEVKGVATENIMIGNGSDEIIDLCFRIFCRPGIDKALSFSPSYGMYKVSAGVNDVELTEVPLSGLFQVNMDALAPFIHNDHYKLIFICSPNNPTGNRIEGIDLILEQFNGIVVVDEAYSDFDTGPSWAGRIGEFPNLIVLQTLSKAWGLAAARVGMGFADARIIRWFNRVKPPYNVSQLNQQAALDALSDTAQFENRKALILAERDRVIQELRKCPVVVKVYPTDANFILTEVKDADRVYSLLVEKGIVVRNRNSAVKNTIRITVGSPEENEVLLRELKMIEL